MNTATAFDHQALDTIQVNPLFMRHDLMIEMARLEMKLESVLEADPDDRTTAAALQQRIDRVAHILGRLAA